MAQCFRADAALLEPRGYASVARVPFILSWDMRYMDEVNRHMRERAGGDWHPKNGTGVPVGKVRIPSDNTVRAISDDLTNFLSYTEVHGLDWRTLAYDALRDGYEAAMYSGAWSADGDPLSPSTVNRRVQHACDFLLWAGDRTLRPPFTMRTGLSRPPKRGGTASHQGASINPLRRALFRSWATRECGQSTPHRGG